MGRVRTARHVLLLLPRTDGPQAAVVMPHRRSFLPVPSCTQRCTIPCIESQTAKDDGRNVGTKKILQDNSFEPDMSGHETPLRQDHHHHPRRRRGTTVVPPPLHPLRTVTTLHREKAVVESDPLLPVHDRSPAIVVTVVSCARTDTAFIPRKPSQGLHLPAPANRTHLFQRVVGNGKDEECASLARSVCVRTARSDCGT